MVVNHYVGAGNLTCILCRNKCHLSSPSGFLFVAFVGFVTSTEAGFTAQCMCVEVRGQLCGMASSSIFTGVLEVEPWSSGSGSKWFSLLSGLNSPGFFLLSSLPPPPLLPPPFFLAINRVSRISNPNELFLITKLLLPYTQTRLTLVPHPGCLLFKCSHTRWSPRWHYLEIHYATSPESMPTSSSLWSLTPIPF